MWNFLVFFRLGDEFYWHQLINLHLDPKNATEEWWDKKIERDMVGHEIGDAIEKHPDFDAIMVVHFAKIRDGINQRLKEMD